VQCYTIDTLQATDDYNLKQITPGVTAYGGATLSVIGQVLMEVERGTHQYKLDCKLVNCTIICPLLG